MKKITTLNKQEIILEGFGIIEISESYSGEWKIDLFPRGNDNDRNKILLETTFSGTGDKYFERPNENKNRMDEVYNNVEIER